MDRSFWLLGGKFQRDVHCPYCRAMTNGKASKCPHLHSDLTPAFRQWRSPSAQAYMATWRAEGKSKTEVIRCLNSWVAREIYKSLITPREQQVGSGAV